MDPAVLFNAYKSGELDVTGYNYGVDLPPSALAEVMANPELKKQLIAFPNFDTWYLFFDTGNPPFNNLKVRQAFSHAVNRDAVVNGPLKYQGMAAYSMLSPGFPSENVKELKNVQTYDPKLAAKLMEEAGYPGGKGFPKLIMYTRLASPALTNAAETIAAMIKESLGVQVTLQDMDYSTYMETLYNQKKKQGGNMVFGLVRYEYDFVDASNMLSVWGGCEPDGATKAQMPGRHTWYSKDFNDAVCKANSLTGDEAQRDQLYQKAEKILIEDVGMVPIYHSILNVLVNPKLKGPVLEPNKAGAVTFRTFIYGSTESLLYRTK